MRVDTREIEGDIRLLLEGLKGLLIWERDGSLQTEDIRRAGKRLDKLVGSVGVFLYELNKKAY